MSEVDISGNVPVDYPLSSKNYWGPRVWKVFHFLSEVSDRKDVSLLWRNWIKHTAEIMPCEKCRSHLRSYLQTHTFIKFQNPLTTNGKEARNHIRGELFKLHNHANIHTNKPIFTQQEYDNVYKSIKSRKAILLEVQKLMGEIETSWLSIQYINLNKGEYTEWKNHYSKLLGIVSGGSTN